MGFESQREQEIFFLENVQTGCGAEFGLFNEQRSFFLPAGWSWAGGKAAEA
jgi:hypothetical protein